MKRIIQIVTLFLISLSTAYASWTVIDARIPVQCNHWGWVKNYDHTVWKNPCTPLEVKKPDGTIIAVRSTNESGCKENEAALYAYYSNDHWINFKGCIPITALSQSK